MALESVAPRLWRGAWPWMAAVVATIEACGGGSPTAPGAELTVTIERRGNGTVLAGVVVSVTAQGSLRSPRVNPGESVTIEVPPGLVQVDVSGIPDHCWMDETLAELTVAVGTPGDVVFEITCVGDFAYRTDRLDQVAYRGTDGKLTTYIYPGAVSLLAWNPTGTAVLVGAWPAWSPKCARSLFHVETGTVTPVARPDLAYSWGNPSWSPAGDRLVLGRTRDCGNPSAEVALMLYDATGTTALDSVPGILASAVSWRPGTQQVAYQQGGRIRLHSWADHSDSVFVELQGDVTAWSPNGDRMAVQVTGLGQIVVVDGGGQELFRLGGTNYLAFEPLWAPDGSGLLFSCVPPSQKWDVCYAAADGSNERAVTTQEGSDGDVSWAADGDYFFYTSNRSGFVRVFLGNILGQPHRQIVRQSGSSEARFSPNADLALD